MAPSARPVAVPTDRNAADAAFVTDLLRLLRDGLLISDAAVTGSHDRAVVRLAVEASAASTRQIETARTYLDQGGRRDEEPVRRPDGAPHAVDDPDAAGYDSRMAGRMVAQHRSVIARSRQEMVEGFSARPRQLAAESISMHHAALARWQRTA